MVGDVGERAADYGLTPGQQDFLEWVRRVAADLADVPPVHGAVNRQLIRRPGELGLPRTLFGGDVVPAFALSEPDAGSDAAALSLEARPDGDGWTLHGAKTWISNAPDADVYAVFARTTAGTRARGVTAFAVAGDSEGLTGERLDMVAPHALGTLHLD